MPCGPPCEANATRRIEHDVARRSVRWRRRWPVNAVSKGGIRESDARAGGDSLREDLSTFLGPPTPSDKRAGRIGEPGCASGATSGGKQPQPKRRSQYTQRARARRVDKRMDSR